MPDAELPTPAEILRGAGVPFSSFSHAPVRTYDDIVRVLGLPPDHLVKTMAFRTADGAFVLAALPISARLGYGHLARAVGVARSSLRQAGPEDLRELRMEPGGVSPLTRARATTVAFDASVAEMGTVCCGSGRADETIEVDARALIDVAGPILARIAA